MASRVVSFRLEEELVTQLDALAKATDHDRLYHLKRAVAQYLHAESRHVKAIQVGIAAADAGKLTDVEDVKARWMTRAEQYRVQ